MCNNEMHENQIISEIWHTNNSIERLDDEYYKFLESVQNNFNSKIKNATALFKTDSTGLYEAYLNNLPDEARQHYNCNACKHFINRFGDLVTISETGVITSVIWDELNTPKFFAPSVEAMNKIILKSKVIDVFFSGEDILGYPITGEWHHLAVRLPSEVLFKSPLYLAINETVKKREERKMLNNALKKYPIEIIDKALLILQSEALYRSEKCLGVAEWLKNIYTKISATKNTRMQENIIWRAVATAPAGFCHVNSTMIGTLLEDLSDDLPFESIKKRFAEKMDPLKYQRPQAAPAEGNIKRAEEIVEKMGIKNSLVRRFATLDEIEKIWVPKIEEKNETENDKGVFSHLLKDNKEKKPEINIPVKTMTWKKFYETILPTAENIDLFIKSMDIFTAIVTATYEDAPPILQWDNEQNRNPFSVYIYKNGSPCDRWNIQQGYREITGICFVPWMWYNKNKFNNYIEGVILIIKDAKDVGYKNKECIGNALFPEILRSELHEIRSTIEAYSKTATIESYDNASACGVILPYGENLNTTLRVTSSLGTLYYKLDRWD